MKNNLLLTCSLAALSYTVISANLLDSAVNTAETAVNTTVQTAEKAVERVVPSREPMMYTSGLEDESMMEAPMQEQVEQNGAMYQERGASHHQKSRACTMCAKKMCTSCNPSK